MEEQKVGSRAVLIDQEQHGEFNQEAFISYLAKRFLKYEELEKEKASVGAETQNEIYRKISPQL